MAINVRWADSEALGMQLGQRAGRGQLAIQAQERALNDERFRLQLEESQRQADLGLAFRAQQAAVDNDLQRQQLAGTYALGQQRLAADAFGDQQSIAANLYARQQQYANNEAQRAHDWGMDSVDGMEKQLQQYFADMSKQQLGPEGKRQLHELRSAAMAAMGQRGVGMREDAYAGVLSEIMEDVGRAGLEMHIEHEPDPQELWGRQTYTTEDGDIMGLDRNGTFRKLKDAPPRPLSKEEIDANTYELPTGETMFINPLDGRPTLSTPPKETADPNAIKPIGPLDRMKFISQAFTMLDTMARNTASTQENGTYSAPDMKKVLEMARELEEASTGGEEEGGGIMDMLKGMFGGGGQQGGETRQKITAPNGAQAYVNPDGTVEPIQ